MYMSDFIFFKAEVRLSDGPVPSEGRAECKVNGTWGVICDQVPIPSEWPSILCADLGFGEALSAINVCNFYRYKLRLLFYIKGYTTYLFTCIGPMAC